MDRKERYIENFSRMLRCPTVSGYDGHDDAAFSAFRETLREIFPHLFAAAETELFHSSMLLRWKGKVGHAPFLFMCHHDVVAAQEGWSHAPFGGEVAEGRLWGRGALDTKGGLWAMLQAADDLCAEGYVPERDIYFESSCNEETTCAGAAEIAEVLAARGIRFSLVMDEGGMIMYEPIGGAKGTFGVIGMGERCCVDLKFTARSGGGHASTPEHDTPLVRLGKFMAEADRFRVFSVQVSPTIQEMFRRLAPSVRGPLGFVYAHPVLFGPVLNYVMPRLSATSRALVQTTIAFTMASGSDSRNAIPAEAWVIGNMRCSHHQGFDGSLQAITALAEKYGIETEVLDPGGASGLSDYRSPQFAYVESALNAVFPGVVAAPYIMTGCSDARFMSAVSDNVYRFLPFCIDEQQMESIHGIDENVGVDTLIPAADFFKYLITEMKHCE